MGPHVRLERISAVMVFADDPEGSARWWAELTGLAVHSDSGFWWLVVGDTEFGFHPADSSKNPTGASTVPYWLTADLDGVVAAVRQHGGQLLRGPLVVEPGRRIAQVVDPFGAVVGIEERMTR